MASCNVGHYCDFCPIPIRSSSGAHMFLYLHLDCMHFNELVSVCDLIQPLNKGFHTVISVMH